MNLWIDVENEAPMGWVRVSNYQRAQELLSTVKWKTVSIGDYAGFDNNGRNRNGYDVVQYVGYLKMIGSPIGTVEIHARNPFWKDAMETHRRTMIEENN
jgi:hypothetical protein